MVPNSYDNGKINKNPYLMKDNHKVDVFLKGARKILSPLKKKIYFCFIDYAKAFDSVDHNKLWKILKEMGIPDHLTCLLRNLYAG